MKQKPKTPHRGPDVAITRDLLRKLAAWAGTVERLIRSAGWRAHSEPMNEVSGILLGLARLETSAVLLHPRHWHLLQLAAARCARTVKRKVSEGEIVEAMIERGTLEGEIHFETQARPKAKRIRAAGNAR